MIPELSTNKRRRKPEDLFEWRRRRTNVADGRYSTVEDQIAGVQGKVCGNRSRCTITSGDRPGLIGSFIDCEGKNFWFIKYLSSDGTGLVCAKI